MFSNHIKQQALDFKVALVLGLLPYSIFTSLNSLSRLFSMLINTIMNIFWFLRVSESSE
jgi:hypothetical protein